MRTTSSTVPAGVPRSVGSAAPGSCEGPQPPSWRNCGGQLFSAEGAADGAAEAVAEGSATSLAPSVGTSGRVQDGVLPRLGVGSKRVQPTPSKYSSGQACASRSPTEIAPSDFMVPGVKPTATRAGMPSVRAIAAIENEKWTQKPSLSRRNRAMAVVPVPEVTDVSYVKPPSEANQSWSFTARS